MRQQRKKIKNSLVILLCLVLIIVQAGIVKINAKPRVTISAETLELKAGKSKKVRLFNTTSKAKITWSSSNKFTATVSKKGRIKAQHPGTARITAKYKKKYYTCSVVVPDNSKIRLNTYSVMLNEGSIYQLTAATSQQVSYISRNEHIAKVSKSGEIIALNPGTVDIIVKNTVNQTRCTVTVNSLEGNPVTTTVSRSATAIRRLTKNNNIKYEPICWAKNKDIRFKIANIDEDNVKKCVWKTSDANILSKPSKGDSKIVASAKTIQAGTAIITAVVTDKNGRENTYTQSVYVSAPVINTKSLLLLGSNAGNNRQQYISFSGLSKYSHITWSTSNSSAVKLDTYKSKSSVCGINPGAGVIKASVDGKTYNVNFTVFNPVFGNITSVLPKNNTTKIVIGGMSDVMPIYSSRNTSVATVLADGTVKGIKAGVTYIDVKIGSYNFYYRVEVAAKGIKKIINRATYIVNNWKYSQKKRMKKGYYDCSALVWKGYKAYKNYQKKLGSKKRAFSAGELFDYLYNKNDIIHFGYLGTEYMCPGDLIFYGNYSNAVKYSTSGRTLNIYHVAMYAGNGRVIEKGGQTINCNNTRHIVGIGRVVN